MACSVVIPAMHSPHRPLSVYASGLLDRAPKPLSQTSRLTSPSPPHIKPFLGASWEWLSVSLILFTSRPSENKPKPNFTQQFGP